MSLTPWFVLFVVPNLGAGVDQLLRDMFEFPVSEEDQVFQLLVTEVIEVPSPKIEADVAPHMTYVAT
jgi:hypothetical protein